MIAGGDVFPIVAVGPFGRRAWGRRHGVFDRAPNKLFLRQRCRGRELLRRRQAGPLDAGFGSGGVHRLPEDKYANDVSIKTYPVQASLLAYLVPHSPISPYLLGGTGWYFTRVSGGTAETQTDNRFGLHAGAGLEARLNEFLSVDGSYRYVAGGHRNQKRERLGQNIQRSRLHDHRRGKLPLLDLPDKKEQRPVPQDGRRFGTDNQ
ncbi:MAG: porin family protein [Elusimicrobia bacterium]|nr:porin family protein [Elusimicrobiota bacterium]